ncbi:MAG: DUF433 domain-containing protein [Bacteroidetes bacterium]|nr:DUF433 domain-containing protein [Bacteroidota bacterium]
MGGVRFPRSARSGQSKGRGRPQSGRAGRAVARVTESGLQPGKNGVWRVSAPDSVFRRRCRVACATYLRASANHVAKFWNADTKGVRITSARLTFVRRPCVRGMRIWAVDVLVLLAAGLSREQILDELPDLEEEDVEAALRYGSRCVGFA